MKNFNYFHVFHLQNIPKYDTLVHLSLNTESVKLHTLNYDGCTNPKTPVATDTCVTLYTYSTHTKKINNTNIFSYDTLQNCIQIMYD